MIIYRMQIIRIRDDQFAKKADLEGWQAVYDELVAVDPIAGRKSLRFQINNYSGIRSL